MQPLPPSFVTTINSVFEAEGRAWLAELPTLLQTYADRWELTLGAPFDLSYNYVCAATRRDGTPVVLKSGVPDTALTCEIEALRHWDGQGAVALLEDDATAGVFLLEQLVPGTTLRGMADSGDAGDDAATRHAATVMAALWRPAPTTHTFPTTQQWANDLGDLRAHFDGGSGPFPPVLVDRAEQLFVDLLSSAAEPVLLHGDLHHENILAADRAPWLAIDPKGVVGEPAYEVGALLRNPDIADWPDLPRRQARRIDILAEMLKIDRARLTGYGLAQAILSAWWYLEDHDAVSDIALATATSLNDLPASYW